MDKVNHAGYLSIRRIRGDGDCVRIQLENEQRNVVVNIETDLGSFAEALLGLLCQPCKYRVYGRTEEGSLK